MCLNVEQPLCRGTKLLPNGEAELIKFYYENYQSSIKDVDGLGIFFQIVM